LQVFDPVAELQFFRSLSSLKKILNASFSRALASAYVVFSRPRENRDGLVK